MSRVNNVDHKKVEQKEMTRAQSSDDALSHNMRSRAWIWLDFFRAQHVSDRGNNMFPSRAVLSLMQRQAGLDLLNISSTQHDT